MTVETNGAVRVKKKWDYEELGPEKTIDFWVIITNQGHNGGMKCKCGFSLMSIQLLKLLLAFRYWQSASYYSRERCEWRATVLYQSAVANASCGSTECTTKHARFYSASTWPGHWPQHPLFHCSRPNWWAFWGRREIWCCQDERNRFIPTRYGIRSTSKRKIKMEKSTTENSKAHPKSGFQSWEENVHHNSTCQAMKPRFRKIRRKIQSEIFGRQIREIISWLLIFFLQHHFCES